MDTTCVYSALRGQKRVSEPLEVELHMVLNHHVSTELLQEQRVLLTAEHLPSPVRMFSRPLMLICLSLPFFLKEERKMTSLRLITVY